MELAVNLGEAGGATRCGLVSVHAGRRRALGEAAAAFTSGFRQHAHPPVTRSLPMAGGVIRWG
jgi:hypothetical protein